MNTSGHYPACHPHLAGVPLREIEPTRLASHRDRLYRTARALSRSRDDAEDLVQDMYVNVLARPRVVRGGNDLAYLRRALRNTFVNRARTRRETRADVEIEDVVADASRRADPATALAAKEVCEAVASLSPAYRDAVAAVDLTGLSYREAALSLGVPVGTVMSRLHRGRAAVAHLVGDDLAA
jgi:RNA polymerase sigma-70 factor (ECF subfamily)